MAFKFFNNTGQELQASLIANMPIGSIIDWATDTPPAGWLKCDGSAISRTDYADLFNTIGTAYGTGNGTTTFNVPDITGSIVYSSLISRSGSSLLPVADGSVTTAKIADSSITDAKLATALANNLGLDNSSNTRRKTASLVNSEKITNSTTFVDVPSPGVSLSLTIPSNSIVLAGITAEFGGANVGYAYMRLVVGDYSKSSVGDPIGGDIAALTNVYVWQSTTLLVDSAVTGTGTKTVKAQLRTSNASYGAYVKNCYISAVALTV